MPLTKEQASALQDPLFATVDANKPPLDEAERYKLNEVIYATVQSYVTGGPVEPPQPGDLPIIPLPWISPSRSATQLNACQFKFTVSSTEVPRPGDLSLSPAGPAGNEVFHYQWGTEPFKDAEGGTQGNRAKFSVTTPKDGSYTVVPGQTYYVAVKMTGGNTGGKFLGELHINAPY